MFQGMNPKMVKQAMKKMGMKQEDIPATEVIIKTQAGDLLIRNPQVAKITMAGEESFQITGQVERTQVVNEGDIETVMTQAQCSREQAHAALEKSDGDLAEAILNLQES
jgi:nascent polypeptide-associated complex subunit alpha